MVNLTTYWSIWCEVRHPTLSASVVCTREPGHAGKHSDIENQWVPAWDAETTAARGSASRWQSTIDILRACGRDLKKGFLR